MMEKIKNKIKNTLREEHQWMSAKVRSLEADSFFIKINCVAEAAYLSVPPADTCPPPTAVHARACLCVHLHPRVDATVYYVCVYVCVPMLSNNGSVIRHCQRHMNESEGNTDPKSVCSPANKELLL